jgi:WD40 repeat protein/serine/threonine protein kinase
METIGPRRQTVEQLAEEFVERYRRGERPPLSEYTARYPEHAAEIRDLFPALVMMEQIAPDSEAASLALPPASPRGRPIKHPERLGDYRILREIGRGGMGVVYEAEQVSLGRHVALKVLPQQFLVDDLHQKRFEREAKAAARLHHTNIVPVFGVGEESGLHYYVMQFIAGLGLDQVLDELKRLRSSRSGTPALSTPGGPLQVSPRDVSAVEVAQSLLSGTFQRPAGEAEEGAAAQSPSGAATLVSGKAVPPSAARPATGPGRLSDTYSLSASADALLGRSGVGTPARPPTYWQSVAHIGAQVAAGLEHAHQQGVLHRDIKPANLLLDLHGNVWITDFGLAKSTGQENLTATGDVVGTLRYMAPEVFRGRHDARSEVCALGLTMYELLALQPAFNETDRHQLIHQVITAEPPRLDRLNRGIPRDLVTIVHKAIDRDPAHRYQTAAEMAEDLQRFLRDEPVRARRVSTLERLVRWARRYTGVATALAVIGLLLVGTAIASVLAAWKFETMAGSEKAARDAAERALDDANDARNKAEKARDEERWERYRSNIAAASAALELRNTDTARRALDNLAPTEYRDCWEWRHFHSQLDGASLVLKVPGGPITLLCLSPSGQQLAVACRDQKQVHLFHIPTGRSEAILGGHGEPVSDVAYSPDGKSIATAARDGTCRLWDPATGRERAVLRGSPGTGQLIYSPDGRRILTRMGDEVHLWDASTGRSIASLGQYKSSEWYLQGFAQFGPTGRRLVSALTEEVSWWDAATGKVVAVLGRVEGAVEHVAYSPDGKRIAAISAIDKDVHLWDGETGKEMAVLSGHTTYVTSLLFSPARSARTRLLSMGDFPECAARLWDAEKGQLIAVLGGHTNRIWSAAFSPDGRRIATASMDRTVRLWDGATGQLVAVLRGHTGMVRSVKFSPDGTRLVTVADDATSQLWDAQTGELRGVLRGHSGHGETFAVEPAFTPDGSYFLSGAPDGSVRLWDLRLVERSGGLHGHESYVYDVAFRPDGEQVASASWDGTVRLWDVTTGRQTGCLDHTSAGHKDRLLSGVAYSRDGRQIVTVARNLGVTLWDATTSRQQQSWPIVTGYWGADCRAVLNPAGDLVAAGSFEGPVHLCDAKTGKLVALLRGHRQCSIDVAFRPDGAQLATAGEDGTVRLWDPVTHKPLAVLVGHNVAVNRVAYNADGTLLASGSQDRTIRLWDVQTHREVAKIPLGSVVFGVAFSPDGKRLAAGCGDNTIHLLDVARRQEVAELRGHRDYVHAVAWSPDGTRLVSGSGDLTVRIWDSLPVQERARSRQATQGPDRHP